MGLAAVPWGLRFRTDSRNLARCIMPLFAEPRLADTRCALPGRVWDLGFRTDHCGSSRTSHWPAVTFTLMDCRCIPHMAGARTTACRQWRIYAYRGVFAFADRGSTCTSSSSSSVVCGFGALGVPFLRGSSGSMGLWGKLVHGLEGHAF